MPRSRAIRERGARASQGSARRREIGSPKQLLLVIREKDDLAVSIRPRRIYSFRRTCTMVGTFINLVLSMVGIANLEEAAAEMIPVFLDALVLVMRKGFS